MTIGTYNFTKDHVSVLNYFRIVDICKIDMFDNNMKVDTRPADFLKTCIITHNIIIIKKSRVISALNTT